MSYAKRKGSEFEQQVADYLAAATGHDITREHLHGSKDVGDIHGFRIMGRPCAVECKNRTTADLSGWLSEALAERDQAGADYGVVVFKRRGAGTASFGKTYVLMDLETLAAISAGGPENIF